MARTAERFAQRPSALLGLDDPYLAYCLDEAAAWLLCQKEPPVYDRDRRAINNNPKILAALAAAGGAKIVGT